ncbi:MAG: tRNA 2-thiouridine(34) synthase MnmA [bacterium]|nr:tRNA 2-thiouridine(34) synthase MnmA [bacterium]
MRRKVEKNKEPSKRVLVAMSGGVDSSVAAALLQKQGYRVEGAYMQCWSSGPYCSTEKDRSDALRVATQLDIPFQVFDFEKEYKEAVLDYFFAQYQAGRTPNPDVACNREVKFGIFLHKALELGFDYIATGHYARIQNSEFRIRNVPLGKIEFKKTYKLLKGVDPAKDQSYFLYTLGQEQLKHTLFPIGEYRKKEVREIAGSLGLVVADKKDSQGICFIGPVNVASFLRQNLKTRLGDVVSLNGEVLGRHDGLAFYTIGQREGIRISSSLPHYVVRKKITSNELVVAPIGSEAIYSSQAQITNLTFVADEKPKLPLACQVSLRYRQEPQDCRLREDAKQTYSLDFKNPQRAVTEGQAAVFFVGEQVLGGGAIEKTF